MNMYVVLCKLIVTKLVTLLSHTLGSEVVPRCSLLPIHIDSMFPVNILNCNYIYIFGNAPVLCCKPCLREMIGVEIELRFL
jgi:hypothetical protein